MSSRRAQLLLFLFSIVLALTFLSKIGKSKLEVVLSEQEDHPLQSGHTEEVPSPRSQKRYMRLLSDSLAGWRPEPLVVHAPHGSSRNRTSSLQMLELYRNQMNGTCTCPPGLLGIYVWSGEQDTQPMMRSAYETCGCPYVQLRYNADKWDWFGKIGPVLDFLREGGARKYTHILFTDAGDVMFTKDISDIVNTFKLYDADMVFMNTCASWPANDECEHFESIVNPWSKMHRHLSAGGFMADVKVLPFYLGLLEVRYHEHMQRTKKFDSFMTDARTLIAGMNETTEPAKLAFKQFSKPRVPNFDDQLEWRKLHLQYWPNLKIDSLSRIFQRFDEYNSTI